MQCALKTSYLVKCITVDKKGPKTAGTNTGFLGHSKKGYTYQQNTLRINNNNNNKLVSPFFLSIFNIDYCIY